MVLNLGSPLSGERRSKPRIYIPFPATVQGVDESGNPFEVDTVIDNLSGNSEFGLEIWPTSAMKCPDY